MSFDVAARAYGRFIGPYSAALAEKFVDLLGVEPGQRALDVGCGPGELEAQLVRRLGADAVAAIDPSEPFVESAQQRLPGADIRNGVAESLPFADDSVDVAASQLVVHFMTDPVAGLAEMARVTRPGGVVAACVWDYAGDRGPLSVVWRAARDLDSQSPDESDLAGVREGHLTALMSSAGLHSLDSTALSARVSFASFEDWWQPNTLGVGPPGAYVASLDRAARARLAGRCAELLGPAPFEIEAVHRMVLGTHCQSLVRRVGRRPLGHGPGHQYTVDLQPDVEVQCRRLVPLDHEQREAADRGCPAGRLAGAGKVTASQVLLQLLCAHLSIFARGATGDQAAAARPASGRRA